MNESSSSDCKTNITGHRLQDRLTENPGTIIKNHFGGYQRHSPRFILGYWSTRCLGAPLRMILSAAQIDHWVLLYDAKEEEAEDDDDWDKSSWLRDKEWLQKDHPLINLPFLVDCAANDRVISQSYAIAMYLGRELKLFGASTREKISYCEELLCEITDLRDLMLDFAYKTDQSTCEADAKIMLRAAATRHVDKLERVLKRAYPDAEDRQFNGSDFNSIVFSMQSVVHLDGENFTVPDFYLWEILDQFEGLCKRLGLPNCFGDARTYTKIIGPKHWENQNPTTIYPYLKEFHDHFLDLPANHVYAAQYELGSMQDMSTIRLPYNSPYARFGSCPDPLKIYVRGQEVPWRNQGVVEKSYTRIDSGIEYWEDGVVPKQS